jgi:hypothetical protein
MITSKRPVNRAPTRKTTMMTATLDIVKLTVDEQRQLTAACALDGIIVA